MKIVFICACMEPGKDGVGDYTRRLAAEVQLRGEEVLIISLNDKFIEHEVVIETQTIDTVSVNVIRNKQNTIAKIDWFAIKKQIDLFAPDRISLQFVIYGFHPKGLPFGLSSKFNFLFESYITHLMFHELWVGIEDGASYKHRLYGFFQKRIIKQLILNVSPQLITTNTDVYKWQLTKMGFEATILPLFSNIPHTTVNETQKDNKDMVVVVFGNIHYSGKFLHFLHKSILYCKQNDKKLCFKFIGRNGPLAQEWIGLLEKCHIDYENLGMCTAEDISGVLNMSTIGISTTPLLQSQKSGVIAAYMEHEIITVVIGREWNVKKIIFRTALPNVYDLKDFEFENVYSNKFDTTIDSNNIFEMYLSMMNNVNVSNIRRRNNA